MKKILLFSLFLAVFSQINAQFQAGVGRKVITPDSAIWLSGYAARTKPSDAILHDIWAKALVIDDNKGNRIIIVTMDIIGLSHELSETIAVNRRQKTEKGYIIGVNNEGPVDPDVPVLKIVAPNGKLRAVLFGYACHNTTLDIYQVNGDYAGFAQIEIEKAYPEITAMFMAGCGADQNPNPRRSVEFAIQHGKTLAGAVQTALSGEFVPVHPPIRTYFATVGLEFAPVNPDQFKEEMLSNDRFRQSRAILMLEAIDKGYDIRTLLYPVQAVRFSKYEPETSMIYYGLPGPFASSVEEKVFSAIDLVMKKTGAKPDRKKNTP